MAATSPNTAESGPQRPPDGTERRTPSSAAQRAAQAATRAQRALDMYVAGQPFEAIAVALGYHDRSGAKKAVDRALATVKEETAGTAADHRARLRIRYERLYSAAAIRALSGDVKMMGQARAILDSLARLDGANAPTQVHVTGQMDEEIEALLAQLGVADEATP